MAGELWDAVVVGTGFGGSVTAARLAAEGRRVLVLERGRPWPPGSFPRTPRDMPRILWDPEASRFGVFDVWGFDAMTAVVASGLGGGSLIYANVQLRKPAGTFAGWPLDAADLDGHYARIEAVLHPTPYPEHWTRPGRVHEMPKAAAAAGLRTERPPLAVAFAADEARREPVREEVPNLHGVGRLTCRRCGECDIGCNDGAKSTMDLTFLSRARADGAVVRALSEARAITRLPDGTWELGVLQHSAGRDGADPELLHPDPAETRFTVRAKHVVLAGGTLGSVRLLWANRHVLPGLSDRLGRRVSANGDLLGFVRGAAVWLDPSAGPVITTSTHVPADRSPSGRAFYVQDGGHPQFVDWLWNLLDLPGSVSAGTRTAWRRWLDRARGRRDPQLSDELARLIGPATASGTMMPVLAMGHDDAGARIVVDDDGEPNILWDGDRAYFDGVRQVLHTIAHGLGGRFQQSPGAEAFTVHPVGGCAMSPTPEEGVCDPLGRVHRLAGLHVHCGAVLPGAVGPNPSLTIAAVADRCSDALLEDLS